MLCVFWGIVSVCVCLHWENVLELFKEPRLSLHSNSLDVRCVLGHMLSFFCVILTKVWKKRVIPAYLRERRGASVLFCLWENLNFFSIQANMVASLFITYKDATLSNRSKGRMSCLMPCINACLWNVPFACGYCRVIFEAYPFTKYLGSIHCVSATSLGSGDRAVNKIPFLFLSEILVKQIVWLGN